MRLMRISDEGLMNLGFAALLNVYIWTTRKLGCSEDGSEVFYYEEGASVINVRCGLLFSGSIICCYYLDGACNWSRQLCHLSTDWVFSSMFRTLRGHTLTRI